MVHQEILIGIDIGTTGIKVIAINLDGVPVYTKTLEHDLLSPEAGYAEEDAEIWVDHTLQILADLTNRVQPRTVHGIGIAGMVPTLIPLDSDYRPLMNSIQQNDIRANREIDRLSSTIDGDWFFHATGNRVNSQHIFPKLQWIKHNRPQDFSRISHLVGSYNYVAFRLTGVLTLERNWALESGMWHLDGQDWIDPILEVAEITRSVLPPVLEATDTIGGTTEEVQRITGIPRNTPVIAGSADHVASAFSSGGKRSGDLVIKLGGAGDILLSTDIAVTDDRLFIDYHCATKGHYFLNGCTATSGSMLKWFQRQWDLDDYDVVDEEAATIGVGSRGVMILPYFLGEKTPIFDVNARGVIYGLSLSHTKYDLYHAALEAVAFSMFHHLEVFSELQLPIRTVYITNGGSKSTLWRQIMADVLGHDLHYVRNHPGSSLGAAVLAGIGTGHLSPEVIDRFTQDQVVTYHNSDNHEKYLELFAIYKEIYTHLRDLFVRTAGLL